MEKIAEFLKSGIVSFFFKILFEAIILGTLLYGWILSMDVKFSRAEETEKDLVARVLVLEKGSAFNDGAVSTQLKSLGEKVGGLETRMASLETYLRARR